MRLRFACLSGLALALSAAVSQASAPPAVPAASFSGPTTTLTSGAFTLGWEFQTSQEVSVQALGVLDATGAGLVDSYPVGLWDANGDLLAEATVASGTTDVLDAGFRYSPITPVTLAPGQYYVGALYTTADDALAFPSNNGDAPSTSPLVAYLQATYWQDTTLTDPTNGNGQPGYFGPNFTVVAVPEPAAWALMILGFGMVGAGLRRRPVAVA